MHQSRNRIDSGFLREAPLKLINQQSGKDSDLNASWSFTPTHGEKASGGGIQWQKHRDILDVVNLRLF